LYSFLMSLVRAACPVYHILLYVTRH
jgi:hypothetical protein